MNYFEHMVMTPLEIRESLLGLKNWAITEEGRVEKSYIFSDFTSAVLFINKIVNPIEEYQSYPFIEITYNRVRVSLFDNEMSGVTEKEIKVAMEMDKIAGQTK